MTDSSAEPDTAVGAAALRRATDRLLDEQDAAGWWKGELETNVTMDAEDLLLRQFLGILTPPVAADDGPVDPVPTAPRRNLGDLLRRAARPVHHGRGVRGPAPRRRRPPTPGTCCGRPSSCAATAASRAAGSSPGSGWRCSACGPGTPCPSCRPRLILLPPGAPLNIYDFGCWARQTVVALTVVWAHRPVRPLPFAIDELRTGDAQPAARGRRCAVGWPARFGVLDRLLHALRATSPVGSPRAHAPPRSPWPGPSAGSCAARRPTGCWGGIQPPWVYSMLALHLQGYPLDHPVLRCGTGRARSTSPSATIGAGGSKRASRRSGTPPWRSSPWPTPEWTRRHPAAGGGGGLADRRGGDGCGGTGRCGARSWRPADGRSSSPTTTTPTSTTPPRSCWPSIAWPGDDPTRRDGAIERAVAWTVGMQCRDGGWGAFDADNTSRLCAALPFCDFGEVTDPPQRGRDRPRGRDAGRSAGRARPPCGRRGRPG